MTNTADNTATRLPAIPVASLSPAMREAVERYLATHQAKHDGAEDDASLSAKVDASEAAGQIVADTPARTVADLAAKLIICAHELEPGYPKPDGLYCLFESFPTKLSANLMFAACADAANLAGEGDAELIEWNAKAHQLVRALHALPEGSDDQGLYKPLARLEGRIVERPATTPAGAVEKLLMAVRITEKRWVEALIMEGRFAELYERADELDLAPRLMVNAIEALAPVDRVDDWQDAEQALAAARARLLVASEDRQVDAASDAEANAIKRVLDTPTKSIAHALRKLELALVLDADPVPLIAEARRLAGIAA